MFLVLSLPDGVEGALFLSLEHHRRHTGRADPGCSAPAVTGPWGPWTGWATGWPQPCSIPSLVLIKVAGCSRRVCIGPPDPRALLLSLQAPWTGAKWAGSVEQMGNGCLQRLGWESDRVTHRRAGDSRVAEWDPARCSEKTLFRHAET